MITLELDQMKFEFIYEGFIIGGSLERSKGLISIRRELKILDKLEEISEPFPCGKKFTDIEAKRRLKNDSEKLTIEDDELNLIKRYLGIVPWTTGQPARNFMKVYNWIEQVENDSQKIQA